MHSIHVVAQRQNALQSVATLRTSGTGRNANPGANAAAGVISLIASLTVQPLATMLSRFPT